MNIENFPVATKKRNVGLNYWRFEWLEGVELRKQSQAKKGYDFI
jgi:hypothetical protein